MWERRRRGRLRPPATPLILIFILLGIINISTLAATAMGEECDWSGSGLHPGDPSTRGVTPVYLRCSQGRVTWSYPGGALRVLLRHGSSGRDFRGCIKSSPEFAGARVFLEGPRSLSRLLDTEDGASKQLVRCFHSRGGQAALYVEAATATSTFPRQVAEFSYDLEPLPRNGGSYDPAEECRPCSKEELTHAYCTSDLDIVPLIATASSSSANVARTFMCTTVDHYASTYGDKGWGCGYRNMQMMISSLLHHTGYNEQLYKQWVVGGMTVRGELPSRSAMPSISRLQQHIEWAWRQGFDLQGCDQLGGKLSNTRKWIGATEVVTVLSSLRIRCQLIDFHRPTSANGSHPELFNWVHEYFQANDDFKPPLYLQHQGHSRTIVGVEQLKDGTVLLLVLDPSHSPHQMADLRGTATAMSAMRFIRKSLAAMKARHYQVVAVCGIMDTESEYQASKVLRSMRVPQER